MPRARRRNFEGAWHHIMNRARLDLAMQQVGSRFTQGINRQRRRDGPLFRGRYHSVLVDTTAQVLSVSKYIHLNPVEAQLVAEPDHWEWSSAAAYVGLAERPEWLSCDFVLGQFGQSNPAAAYREFLRAK